MPTTRGTAVKSASTDIHSPIKESQFELRKTKFDARKKREPPVDPTPKQKTLIQLMHSLIEEDKRHLLWIKSLNEGAVGFDSIEDRVYKGKFKDLSSFKSDMDDFFASIIPIIRTNGQDVDAFKQLYTILQSSLQLESKRLKEELTVEPLFESTALFRATTDGYAFTDLTLKDPSTGPTTNLPQNVHELIVHPTPAAKRKEVPTLKNVVAPPPKFYPKVSKHEDKPIVPVQWLDFGAFSSFAPASDSNNANATYESTYMGRSAKRQKTLPEQTDDMGTNDEELNAEWLEKEGLDINAIEQAINQPPTDISQKLERNSELLQELYQYQKTRFTNSNKIDDKELEIAQVLEKSMADMLSKLPPGSTTSTAEIERAMDRLPLFEAAYRGTLPPHKIFSFPTTEKAENLPPYANITPTYQKDNWRLVKVAPFPPKETKTPQLPLVSMLEQQQMNFYQKPVPQPQQQRMPPLPNGTPTPPPFMYQQRR